MPSAFGRECGEYRTVSGWITESSEPRWGRPRLDEPPGLPGLVAGGDHAARGLRAVVVASSSRERWRSVRVYSAPVLAMVANVQQVLESNGIESQIRGEYRGAAVGHIPPIEAWPELWVTDPTQVSEAIRLVKEVLSSEDSDLPSWKCPSCGEQIEGQFSACWNCA